MCAARSKTCVPSIMNREKVSTLGRMTTISGGISSGSTDAMIVSPTSTFPMILISTVRRVGEASKKSNRSKTSSGPSAGVDNLNVVSFGKAKWLKRWTSPEKRKFSRLTAPLKRVGEGAVTVSSGPDHCQVVEQVATSRVWRRGSGPKSTVQNFRTLFQL